LTLLNKAVFICLDCEFTGLDLDNDRIIELAAVRFTFSDNIEEFDKLVKPDCPISQEAFAIHHISAEMVENKPPIEAVLSDFFAFVGRDTIVGHAISSDLEMLTRAAERANIPCALKQRPFIDTLRLARLYGDSPNNSLEKLARHFNIPADPAHRALNDVKMNIEVFKHLVARYKTVEQIMDILARPIQMKFMPLGKHKGRLFSEIPLQYLKWAAHMDFDQDLLYSIRLELKKRKKGGGFREAASPFSEL
jgi:DNA polymerase III subunit epsilon